MEPTIIQQRCLRAPARRCRCAPLLILLTTFLKALRSRILDGLTVGALALLVPSLWGQNLDPITKWATNVSYTASLKQNIVYQRVGALDLRLDVISSGRGPRPVVIYFHGGGWVAGDKEGALLKTLPYLAQGLNVVN